MASEEGPSGVVADSLETRSFKLDAKLARCVPTLSPRSAPEPGCYVRTARR